MIFSLFYKAVYHPISELSEWHYSKKNEMLKNFSNLLTSNLGISQTNNNPINIEQTYNEIKAKEFFNLAYNELSLGSLSSPIELKVKIDTKDKRNQIIFDYLSNKINNIFNNKIILKKIPIINDDKYYSLKEGNLVSLYDVYSECDLFMDFFSTDDFNNTMLGFISNSYNDYIFDIDFTEQLNLISETQKSKLTNDFRYASKNFIGINKTNNHFKGNVFELNAFIINKLQNNNLLNQEIKQKMMMMCYQSLEQKYFEILPNIPLFTVQSCTITNNILL
ncbi:hypothetical protein ['Camptotheca acuminata' phytoplasma]|uniref:hypothetical protein n=1 Tax='Camptotheca acuminata' phytoplasma TaxID=3239192 RepID=UPI00351A5FB8